MKASFYSLLSLVILASFCWSENTEKDKMEELRQWLDDFQNRVELCEVMNYRHAELERYLKENGIENFTGGGDQTCIVTVFQRDKKKALELIQSKEVIEKFYIVRIFEAEEKSEPGAVVNASAAAGKPESHLHD